MPKQTSEASEKKRASLERQLLKIAQQQYRLATKSQLLKCQLRLLDLDDQIASPTWATLPSKCQQSIARSRKCCLLTIKRLTDKLYEEGVTV